MTAISWKNPLSGDWNAAVNWSIGADPTFGDDVAISAPSGFGRRLLFRPPRTPGKGPRK